MFKVYKITNKVNNKFYIGYTKLTLEKRWKLHTNNSSSKMLIFRAIKKYGKDNFNITLLEEYDNKPDAIAREKQLIFELTPGYNIHTGGTGGPMYGPMNGMYGKKHSEEWKKSKSESMCGLNNPMYGKTHTPEVKQLLSELKRGKPGYNKGKKLTEEQKKHLRKPKTELHKQKLRKIYTVNGEIVNNAKAYCLQKGYNYVCFTQAAKKCKTYKGLKVRIAA